MVLEGNWSFVEIHQKVAAAWPRLVVRWPDGSADDGFRRG